MRRRAATTSIRAPLLTACFIVLLPVDVAAQQIGGGMKGGLSLGDVPDFDQGMAAVRVGTHTGVAVGGFLMVRFGGFAIQPEVLYTQKGVKVGVAGEGSIWLRTDFADVPILARYTFGKGLRGYVFAGPSFDFKLNAQTEGHLVPAGTDDYPGMGYIDISSEVKGFEFAFVSGAGVEFGPVLLEVRWSEGLTNLNNRTSETNPGFSTRTYLFLAGFRF